MFVFTISDVNYVMLAFAIIIGIIIVKKQKQDQNWSADAQPTKSFDNKKPSTVRVKYVMLDFNEKTIRSSELVLILIITKWRQSIVFQTMTAVSCYNVKLTLFIDELCIFQFKINNSTLTVLKYHELFKCHTLFWILFQVWN